MPIGPDQMEAIVAIGTPIGAGSRNLIRVSGAGILPALSTVVDGPASGLLEARSRGVATGRLPIVLDSSTMSVPIIVCTAPGPGSFTGEDVVELQVPGHPTLAARVRDELVEMLESAGVSARCAVAGEFSARAFLAGRLGVEEATSIALAIEATQDDDLVAVQRLRADARGGTLTAIRDQLISVAARLEAGIDFTDEEDVVACTTGECRQALDATTTAITRMRAAIEAMGGEASDLPRVVLTGPPNAGKSTLFNVLCGEDRVVVSELAGTTRDSIEVLVTMTGAEAPPPFLLIDTAGVGATTIDTLASQATAASARAIDSADVLVRCRSTDDAEEHGNLESPVAGTVIDVITKGDLDREVDAETTQGTKTQRDHPLNHQLAPQLGFQLGFQLGYPLASDADESVPIRISSITGAGIDTLLHRISNAVSERAGSDIRRSLLDRLARGLHDATRQLDDATTMLMVAEADAAVPAPELVAASIRSAVDELGLLDGSLDPDRVLDDVFGRFCIGK